MTGRKSTNPKDEGAMERLPIASVLAAVALPDIALAMAHGALKYGAHNWAEAGARASVYVDACVRHLWRWWAFGEEEDPDSGVHPLAHAAASLLVLLDAASRGKIVDDRPPPPENVTFDTYVESFEIIRKAMESGDEDRDS